MFSFIKREKINLHTKLFRGGFPVLMVFLVSLSLAACADYDIPGARTVNVPSPTPPQDRPVTIDQQRDAIQYLPLGDNVLRPRITMEDALPNEEVGPFELRSETLAAALQLILSDFDIPLAFETNEGLSRRVTVANLKGDLSRVVARVCGLVDLYCSYEDGLMIVKETETFAVTLPPINSELYASISSGLQAITGGTVVIDDTTRTLLYTTTHRNAEKAKYYFERLRNNTALIIFETHIWEVNLSADNNNGINWDDFTASTGNFIFDLSRASTNIAGALGVGIDFSTPNTSIDSVVEFLSTQGAVKTVSQPQITLLSGSQAELTIGGARDYVSEITRSESGDNDDLSITTDTIETGLSLLITGYLDESTVYGNLEIELSELLDIQEVSAGGTQIQLPETSDRSLRTQIRVRPGDALLIGGIVTERDNYQGEGVGFMSPFITLRQTTEVRNTELVFLLKPRVIVYGSKPEEEVRLPRHSKKKTTENVAMVTQEEKVMQSKEEMILPLEAQKVVEKTIVQPVIADVKPDLSEITNAVSFEISAAKEEVQQTTAEVSALSSTVKALQSELATLKQESLSKQDQISQNVSSQLHATRGDVVQAKTQVQDLSSSIHGLKGDIETLKSLADQSQKQQKDDLIQQKILSQLSALSNRMALLETSIDEKGQTQKQTLQAQLQQTENNINQLNQKIAALEGGATQERSKYLDLKQRSEQQVQALKMQMIEMEERSKKAELEALQAKEEIQATLEKKEILNSQELEEMKSHVATLEKKAMNAELEANKMRVLAALEAQKNQQITEEMLRVQKEAEAALLAKDNAVQQMLEIEQAEDIKTPVAVVEDTRSNKKPSLLDGYLQGISLDSLAPQTKQ